MPEPLERKKERRQGDRRDSLRRKASFVVVHGAARDRVDGELGLGGASFVLSGATEADAFTLELKLGRRVLSFPATVSAVRAARTAVRHVQVTFSGLDTRAELALAKWLDGVDDERER